MNLYSPFRGEKDSSSGDYAGDRGCRNLPAPVAAMQTADGFMVVSRFRLDRPAKPPYAFDYSYSHYADLGDADEFYRDLVNGEHGRWEAVAIVPTLRGVPIGASVMP